MRGMSTNVLRFTASAVLVAVLCVAARAEPRTYVCHRAAAGITIDGSLDDTGWQGIPWVDSFQRFMAPSGGTPQRTCVKAAWDDRNLYIAFRVYDANPWAAKTTRDDALWEEQVVEIYIDENGDLRNYREFEINPRGTVIDLLIPKAGHQSDWRAVARWNAEGWRTATRVYANAARPFWVVEMAFPWGIFDEAENRPPQPDDVWRIQFYRIERPQPGADLVASSWSPTPDFHVPEHFGRLLFAQ
jgi:hypothetical protein